MTTLVPIDPRRHFISGLLLFAIGCARDGEPPTSPELEPTAVSAAAVLAFRQVSAGEFFVCGTTTADAAYCWGSGALGAGSQSFSTRPLAVRGDHLFREVSAGRFHACGVTTGDVALCWGGNNSGQLGDGTGIDRRRPRRVNGGLAFRQITAGSLHSCGVTTGGAAYCWGHNQAGELGDGTSNESTEPVAVAGDLVFRELSAGDQFTCGVTTGDEVYCWGMNVLGQLGVGNEEGPDTCFTGDSFDACSRVPVAVWRGLGFETVSAGWNHACGIKRTEVAFCWGNNESGQLGRGTATGPERCLGVVPCSTRPRRVVGGLRFAAVDGGASHTCGVTTAGVGYCWGSSSSGALGIGSNSGPETCREGPCSTEPLQVAGDHEFSSVSVDLRSGCALTSRGVAFCWGDNEGGQLGDGTTQSRPRPRRLLGPST